MASFIVNTLSPAEVTKVVLDEEVKKVEVIVPDDQLSLAIGRRGQNVRLAHMFLNGKFQFLLKEMNLIEGKRKLKKKPSH